MRFWKDYKIFIYRWHHFTSFACCIPKIQLISLSLEQSNYLPPSAPLFQAWIYVLSLVTNQYIDDWIFLKKFLSNPFLICFWSALKKCDTNSTKACSNILLCKKTQRHSWSPHGKGNPSGEHLSHLRFANNDVLIISFSKSYKYCSTSWSKNAMR